LIEEINTAGLSSVDHLDTNGSLVLIYFNSDLTVEQKSLLDAIVSAHVVMTQSETVNLIIERAITFGSILQRDFVTENVMLGITQRGLTGHVRKTLREVKDALETGSLYDAIHEVRMLNPADFDDTILTPTRLLTFRNKIEEFVNVPLAENWDDEETWL
jgi:hypothetical protein